MQFAFCDGQFLEGKAKPRAVVEDAVLEGQFAIGMEARPMGCRPVYTDQLTLVKRDLVPTAVRDLDKAKVTANKRAINETAIRKLGFRKIAFYKLTFLKFNITELFISERLLGEGFVVILLVIFHSVVRNIGQCLAGV